ncbi:hypothetical protein NUU61_005212 [Penicillium alfredii]|uniref:Anaphase-promoting complex subunit 4 WD40 domain-containing protein n=1 Tax=Penicillium alfredii TaxID=1506179 RepID=A0A9W9F922_9EURO|nr:uncharacterized protein NUU61_005212 [Penicillium alfredii]KAJ5095856.1 hypothetical protein NUU61_005212 [Penicillium alfredii]
MPAQPVPAEPSPERTPRYNVVCSPDGKIIASAHSGPVVKLWDVATRSHLRDLSVAYDGKQASDVVFSSDGKYIASAHASGNVYLFDAAGTQVNRCAFSPDSKELAYRTQDGQVKTWDMNTLTLDHAPSGQKDEL